MKFFKRSKKKTNWKYILIVVIVAVLVGGVLVWQFCLRDKAVSPGEEGEVPPEEEEKEPAAEKSAIEIKELKPPAILLNFARDILPRDSEISWYYYNEVEDKFVLYISSNTQVNYISDGDKSGQTLYPTIVLYKNKKIDYFKNSGKDFKEFQVGNFNFLKFLHAKFEKHSHTQCITNTEEGVLTVYGDSYMWGEFYNCEEYLTNVLNDDYSYDGKIDFLEADKIYQKIIPSFNDCDVTFILGRSATESRGEGLDIDLVCNGERIFLQIFRNSPPQKELCCSPKTISKGGFDIYTYEGGGSNYWGLGTTQHHVRIPTEDYSFNFYFDQELDKILEKLISAVQSSNSKSISCHECKKKTISEEQWPKIISSDVLSMEFDNSFNEKIKIFTTTFQYPCGEDCMTGHINCDVKIFNLQNKEIFHKTIEKCGFIPNIIVDSRGNFYFYDYHRYPLGNNPITLYKYDRTSKELLEISNVPIQDNGARCGFVGHKLYYNKERDALWFTYFRQTYSEGGYQWMQKICQLDIVELADLNNFSRNFKDFNSVRSFDSKIDGRMVSFRTEIINANEAFIYWEGIFYPKDYPNERPIHKNFMEKINMEVIASLSPGTWTKKADFGGVSRHGAIGFSIGDKGYIGMGGGMARLKDFWEYDPSNDTWTKKADFGGGIRHRAVAFSINGKGYVGTGLAVGGQYGKDFWEYDPSNDTWTKKADFGGVPRSDAIGFSIGGKGYVGTGWDGNHHLKDFWEYDPSNDTWTRKADFGGDGRYGATSFSIGDKGYVGTGRGSYIPSIGQPRKDFWEYDPSNDTWTRKADFGGDGRDKTTSFSIGDKGYVGMGQCNGPLTDFLEYDSLNNTWFKIADFPNTSRLGATSFSIGDKGYVGTGLHDAGYFLSDFWEYSGMSSKELE